MAQPYTPSKAQVAGALEHIAYEFEQLIGIVLRMIRRHQDSSTSGPETPAMILEDNVYLEALLLHSRLLADFFEKDYRQGRKGKELDDVLATDYGFPRTVLSLEVTFRQRINQEVAHLSYSRIKPSPSDRHWTIELVVRPILAQCLAFVDFLLSSKHLPQETSERQRFVVMREMLRPLLSNGAV